MLGYHQPASSLGLAGYACARPWEHGSIPHCPSPIGACPVQGETC